jgi:hypothetical protein
MKLMRKQRMKSVNDTSDTTPGGRARRDRRPRCQGYPPEFATDASSEQA